MFFEDVWGDYSIWLWCKYRTKKNLLLSEETLTLHKMFNAKSYLT